MARQKQAKKGIQKARAKKRVGFLNSASLNELDKPVAAFHRGMRELGFVEGKNVEITYQWAKHDLARLPDMARKLVEANPVDDISEYYIALLYNALNTLRFSSLSPVQREHALLCASLLADRLGLGSQ